MKTLKLAFSRILTYFSENKMIFILYLVGTITCIFMMIYYYGNTLIYKTGNSPYDERDFRKFGVVLSSPTEITPEKIEKLKEFEQEYNIQDIQLTTLVATNGSNINFSSNDEANNYFHEHNPNEAFVLSTFMNNNDDISDVVRANIFTNEELSEKVALAPIGRTENIKVGNITFKVVKNEKAKDIYGENDIPEYFIPADAYFASGIKSWRINIWVSERFSENMMYRYADFLRDFFDVKFVPNVDSSGEYDFIHTPKAYYMAEAGDNTTQFYSMMYIFMLSMISFMFLLKYLMDSNRRENSILMMVGAKRKSILFINFIENLILTVSCTVVAIALHAIFYSSLFSKVNVYENITYSLQDYAIIALISVGLSIIVQIPFMFTYWSKNIRKLKDGSK